MIGCLSCIGWVCLSIKPHTHGAHVGIKMHNMDTWRQNSNWCIVNVAKVTFILHRDGKIENWGFLTNWMANLKKRNWHGQFKKSVQRTPIPNATISLTNSRHTNLYICMVIHTHTHTHTLTQTHTQEKVEVRLELTLQRHHRSWCWHHNGDSKCQIYKPAYCAIYS